MSDSDKQQGNVNHEPEPKTTDEVYEDRNLLACALAVSTGAPSGWKPDPETPEKWAIVWIESPEGQLSWHVPRWMAEQFGPIQSDNEWDGHTRKEKNDRLASWSASGGWY